MRLPPNRQLHGVHLPFPLPSGLDRIQPAKTRRLKNWLWLGRAVALPLHYRLIDVLDICWLQKIHNILVLFWFNPNTDSVRVQHRSERLKRRAQRGFHSLARGT